MDSKDSTTSSDESALAALAKEAAALFESGKYDECVSMMNQIAQKKKNDPKVLHNLAIAEFFQDGCSDAKKLLNALYIVKRRGEELARESQEQVPPHSSIGDKGSLGSKGSGTVNQSSAKNTSGSVCTNEFDTSMAAHNMAVLWFHLHEYPKVVSVLEPLYHKIEPIDETVALNICLLLLDALLACQDAERSVDVFSYLEKAFGVSGLCQSDNGIGSQQQSASLVAKSSSVTSVSTADASSLDPNASMNAPESQLSRALSEEYLEYETILKNLDINGQNIGRAVPFSTSNDLSRTSIDRSFPAVDVKLKLQLYKVQILLLTRNIKLAKREVKHAVNVAHGRDSSMALLLKSQLEHARKNHDKAIKLLMASSNQTETLFVSMFSNNLGCIYHQLENFHASSVLLSKALAHFLSVRKEKPLKLSTLSQDKSLLIMYNCGLQYLGCGKPILAAHCFQKASLIFYSRPLLWLRLAECCLMAFEQGLLRTDRDPYERSEIKVSIMGKGKWRHLAMNDGTLRKGLVDIVKEDGSFLPSDGPPELSMYFARQCIHNALHLLNCSEIRMPSSFYTDENDSASAKKPSHNNIAPSAMSASLGHSNANGDANELKVGTGQHTMQSSLSCYKEACKRDNIMTRLVLLSNLAFVELELGNPLKALSTARTLLDFPECSRLLVFLGHVYAAEALCLLNRPKEAAGLLSCYLSGGNNIEIPYTQQDAEQLRAATIVDCEDLNVASVTGKTEDSQDVKFLKPELARGTLFANFATLAAMRGELEQGRLFAAEALSIIPDNPQATLTAVYVDLMQGKSQDAIAKLKECNQVRFRSAV